MPQPKSKLVQIKTRPTEIAPRDFLLSQPEGPRRDDAFILLEMMRELSGEEPVMWGNSIIGFGQKRYRSEKTGREVDWFLVGLALRKSNISVHLAIDINQHSELLSKLGKHKTGAGCLYLDRLADVDREVLAKLISNALNK